MTCGETSESSASRGLARAASIAQLSGTAVSDFLLRRLDDLFDSVDYVREVAVETGLVDADWLSNPSRPRPALTPPLEVLRRFMDRLVERHPSVLGYVGLRAVELLAWNAYWDRSEGTRRPRETTRDVVIVFTDLEGFTAFTAEVGDEQARDVLAQHLSRCMPIIRRRDGRVVKRLGDGLMLAFADETSALLAAVDLLDTAPTPLRLRAGIHAGEVIVLADDFIGQNVNLAARVADAAEPGAVLATTDVLDKIDDTSGLEVVSIGERTFEGIDGPVALSQVRPAGPHRVAAPPTP